MTDTVEEEVVLQFKRFSEEKQDQVRALVNYATLMGLTGKDLVSIGGKLDRIKLAQERKRNQVIADESVKSCTLIGGDKHSTYDVRRWVYTDGAGRKWKFNDADYWKVSITSDTGVKKVFRDLERYAISGRGSSWTMKQVMLNVHHGGIVLNF